MEKKTAFVLVIAAMILFCAGYSNAIELGTIEYNRAGRSLGEISEMRFSICYPLPLPAEPSPVNLGWDWSISLSWQDISDDDVGKTFFASADTHQNFDVFTFPLTNGVNNSLILMDGTVSKFLTYAESALISGIQDGVDFEGYTIDSIAMTVNELFLDNNGDYSYDITYTIYGEAIADPEPATYNLIMNVVPNNIGIDTVIPSVGNHFYGGLVSINAEQFTNCPAVYSFDHWEGDVNDPNSADTTVFMDSHKLVTAVFVDDRRCGDECHPYPAGDVNKDCLVDLTDILTFKDFSNTFLRIIQSNRTECTKPECD